jgi:hypothetical protein
MICQWFDFKTIVTVSPNLALKSVAPVSPGLASKPVIAGSPGLDTKPVVAGFLVRVSKLAATVW